MCSNIIEHCTKDSRRFSRSLTESNDSVALLMCEADDTLAAIAAMIAARKSCMHSWRQGVPDTLAAMTTAVSGSDYALSCYLDTVREGNGTAHPPSPTAALQAN